MSTPMKKRRVIAHQYKCGSDVINMFKCGDCQCFFPTLQTIHEHFEQCGNSKNPQACQIQSGLDKNLCDFTSKSLQTSNRKRSLFEGTSSGAKYINSHGNHLCPEDSTNTCSEITDALINKAKADNLPLEDASEEMRTKLLSITDVIPAESGHMSSEHAAESISIERSNTFMINTSGAISENIQSQSQLDVPLNKLTTESSKTTNKRKFATNDSNENMSRVENTSGEKIFESINTSNENQGIRATLLSTSYENQTCQGDAYDKVNSETDIVLTNHLKLRENSNEQFASHSEDTAIKEQPKLDNISLEDNEDITEIYIANDTRDLRAVSLFGNSEGRLNKNTDMPLLCSAPDVTEMMLSGTETRLPGKDIWLSGKEIRLSGKRKRKLINERSCSTSISPPVPISFTIVNTHSSEKYPKINTKNIVNEESIKKKFVSRECVAEEKVAKDLPLVEEIFFKNEITLNNSITSNLQVRQASIETVTENQSIDVECLDETDEKIANINDTICNNVVDTNANTYATDGMTVTALQTSSNVSNWNEKDLESNVAVIENIHNEVLDPTNSILYIKCEETGNCIASVNISTTNEKKKGVLSNDLSCSGGNVKLGSEEKLSQESNIETHQQHSGCRTKACINQNILINRNNTVSQSQSRVLITYNEKENTDLNLECENNVTCDENDLLSKTFDVSGGHDILQEQARIKSIEMGKQLEFRERNRSPCALEKDISKTFQNSLKRVSVVVERLDITSLIKRKTDDFPHSTENEFSSSENSDPINKNTDSEEQIKPCNGIRKHACTYDEAITQSISNDHRSNKRKCRDIEIYTDSLDEENRCKSIEEISSQEDIKSVGNEVNREKNYSLASCSVKSNNDTAGQTGDSAVDDLMEGNTATEDRESNKTCKYCKQCNTHFTRLSCYINHLILFHHPAYIRQDLTWCPICTHRKLYSSYFNSSLKGHIRFTHGLDEMKCLRCELKCDTFIELQKHVNVCKAGFPRRTRIQSLLYTEKVMCRKCKTFHVYRASDNSGEILKDILQTLPDEQEVNALKEKNEKLQGSFVHRDDLQCKLCKMVFKHLTCALNHAIIVHLKDTRKGNRSLLSENMYKDICNLCNKRHKVVFSSRRQMRRKLFFTRENSQNASEEIHSNDKEILAMIRDGLKKYFGYSNLEKEIYKQQYKQLCKECNINVGTFLCGLHHMIMTHFSRANIDDAMKSSFFYRRNNRCSRKQPCNRKHYFAVSNIVKLRHFLAFGLNDNTDSEDVFLEDNQFTAGCNESSIVKKLREIVVVMTPKPSTETNLKTRVNAVAAKTKEEIYKDMEYRVAYVNGSFVCRLCHSEYKKYSCCKSHVLTEHAVFFSYRVGSEVYTCPDCMMHFYSLYHLDLHLEHYHSVYKFTCIKCEKRFNTYNDYTIHVKHGKSYIQTNFNEELSCKECRLIHICTVQNGEEELIISSSSENETVFKNIKKDPTKHVDDIELRSNIPDQSEQEKGSYSDVAFDGQHFVCIVCLEKFDELACCFLHVVMQHYLKAELICSICKKRSRWKLTHIAHLKNNHGLAPYYCRHCYMGFEEIVLRDTHVEHCQIRTNKVPDVVHENVCTKCYGVHIHVSEGDIKSSCNECELGFASIGCAKNHFYHKHFQPWVILASPENVFRCPCGKDVLSKSELAMHLKNEHSTKQNETDQGETIQSENQKKTQNIDYDSYFSPKENSDNKCVACEHVHIIASNSGRAIQRKETKCRNCQTTFSEPECLQNHIQVAHTSSFQPRKCVGCGLHFVGSRILKLHQNEDRNRNVGNAQVNETVVDKSCRRNVSLVKCDKCEEIHQHQFSTEEKKLKNVISPKSIKEERHRKEYGHKNVYKWCSLCGLAFSNNTDLIWHRRSVHGKIKDEKGIVCNVCNKEIDSTVYYSEHMKKVHCSFEFFEGDLLDDFKRNFSCVYCEKTFSFVMDVQMHLRSKHFEKPLAARKHYRPELEGTLIKGLRILQCPVCLKLILSGGGSVRTHIDSHFNEVLGKEKSNDFVCDICGKCYRTECKLRDHKASHSGIRKYKCNICEKSFMYLVNLQTHSLVHKEKKEKCSVCGMKFTLPHHLRAHMSRKHPEHE